MKAKKIPPYRVVVCMIKAEVKAAKMLHQRRMSYPVFRNAEWSLQKRREVDPAIAHDVLRSLQERVDRELRKVQA